MKSLLWALIVLFFWGGTADANCAIEKKDEFDSLVKELRKLDVDLALEAKRAYGIVSSYEAFEKDSPRCSHIGKLLQDMQDMIDTLK